MYEASFDEAFRQIYAKDPRYPREAYNFVREALDYTQRTLNRGPRRKSPHVTGQELLVGIRDFARAEFGPMAMTVLEEWNIHETQDFGNLVFNMIEVGLLAKTEKDCQNDFAGGYAFFDAFRRPFLPPSRQAQKEEGAPVAPAAN